MPNGDDEWARRYPLPHEQMVPLAERDEARAIARRLANVVRESFDYADGKRVASLADEQRVGREFGDALAVFDALPWAKEAPPE